MLDTLKIALCLKLCRHNLPDPSHDCLWVSYSHRAAMPRISSLESRARYSLHVRGRGGGALLSNFNVAFKSLSYGEGRGNTGSWYQLPLRFSAECAWMKCWAHPLGFLFKRPTRIETAAGSNWLLHVLVKMISKALRIFFKVVGILIQLSRSPRISRYLSKAINAKIRDVRLSNPVRIAVVMDSK